jgi:microsomal dipeptidase-like Zn-dependent dipeptidase
MAVDSVTVIINFSAKKILFKLTEGINKELNRIKIYPMSTFFADLHCHSALFPFNQLQPTVWHEHLHPIYPSQGDFIKLSRGSVRVLFLSLYPVEQGFLTSRQLGLETSNITDALAHLILNMPKERADQVQSYEHNYFDDLTDEYDFLRNFEDPYTENVRFNLFKRKKFKFKIVSGFDELNSILNLDADLNPSPVSDDTIAVILTIEGAHSLGCGQRNTLAQDYTELSSILKENIAKLKNLGPPGREGCHCPFFISLSHHFWNQLGGHSVSLWTFIRKVLDQTTGINEGIKDLGKLAIDELLSKENGRRILIDVAHMSVRLRKWFYKTYLPERESQTGEKIPVIVSHTGVNGSETLAGSEIQGTPEKIHDVADALYKNSKKFNPWDVFISDEEILLIHDSGGLIGLSLDERIMMGREVLETTKKRARWKPAPISDVLWIEPLIEQILHIAGSIYSVKHDKDVIWDNICIGSDYDGMITPVRAYRNADSFPKLDKMIYEQLRKRSGTEPLLENRSDSEIREIADRIVWKNALIFLKKHFG